MKQLRRLLLAALVACLGPGRLSGQDSLPRRAGADSFPHQPAGFTVYTTPAFAQGIPAIRNGPVPGEANWLEVYGDTAYVVAPPLTFIFPAGFVGGSAPANVYYPVAPLQQLYVAFTFTASANWQGHPSGVNKLVYLQMDKDHLVGTMLGGGEGPYTIQFTSEFQGQPTTNYASSPRRSFARGTSHQVEILADVTAQTLVWYVDGAPAGSTRMPFAHPFSEVDFTPVWGGVGATVLARQTMTYTNIRIAGAP